MIEFYEQSRERYARVYPKIKKAIDSSVLLRGTLKGVSKGFTAFLYIFYVLFLIPEAVTLLDPDNYYTFSQSIYIDIILPLTIFLVTTIVRDRINAPRPYELFDITPVIPKKTKGHSCPSRHTACAFAVAFMFFTELILINTPTHSAFFIGIFFIIAAAAVAISRIFIGVHFPLDVLFGFLIALTAQIIGVLFYFKDQELFLSVNEWIFNLLS